MSFDQFGNIIYVKVYVDRHTDGSEGFGLVLYKYVLLAKRVIYQMNVFQIGSKSLKVNKRGYITTVLMQEEEAVLLVKEEWGGGDGVGGQGIHLPLPNLLLRRSGRW